MRKSPLRHIRNAWPIWAALMGALVIFIGLKHQGWFGFESHPQKLRGPKVQSQIKDIKKSQAPLSQIKRRLKEDQDEGELDQNPYDFNRWLSRNSQAIGQIHENPEDLKKEILKKAKQLNLTQMQQLKKMALNTDCSGDQRFFAVYLLRWNQTEAAIPLLLEVANAKIPKSSNPSHHATAQDEELILRMQAIEGLFDSNNPQQRQSFLEQILMGQQNSRLVQYAHHLAQKSRS